MDTESTQSLIEEFHSCFSVSLAENTDQLHEAFKIRFKVYCEEFKYEPVEDFPDQLEQDEYDEISRHCLIIHRDTGIAAGCVRLVPSRGPANTSPLPFEKYCQHSLNQALIDEMKLERNTVCEISRLAVDGRFRRRTGESLTRFGEFRGFNLSENEQRACSLIAVAGFFSATVLTEMHNTTNVFAMMEPFLPRLMKRSGLFFKKVGYDIDYHGIRAPYFITTQSVLETMHDDVRELYNIIKESLTA